MANDNNNIDKEIKKAVLSAVFRALNKGLGPEFGEEVAKKIVDRTKLGTGVNPDTGASQRLKPLSESYKEQRRGDARWITLKDGQRVKIKTGESKAKKAKTVGEAKPKKTRKKPSLGSRLKKTLLKQKKKPKRPKKPEKRLANLDPTTTPSKSNLTATGQLLRSLIVKPFKRKGGAFGWSIKINDTRGKDLFGNQSKIGNNEIVKLQEKQGRSFFGLTKSQRNQIAKEIRQLIKKFL